MADKQAPKSRGSASGTSKSTIAGASQRTRKDGAPAQADAGLQRLADKDAATQALAAAMPSNPLKQADHGLAHGHAPQAGQPVDVDGAELATSSTTREDIATPKTGAGKTCPGHNAVEGNLDRVRADAKGQVLTTNQGVPIADNQNSLKAGLRGPTAMEDFILREKITHFDHERIPERVVHARGSAAHGYFENYKPLTDLTRASLFAEAGKRTPVFVRFSTVAGERGSADLARDVRGFAVKFYTDEGNWDLVGNNIPVFFIQDAMKFPDLVHAVKPEPHHGMPQAASAHDTFWDFASLSPEIAHMLMWVMSDRAIPRSYRMMQGFGVHTFRLVNAQGQSVFCKFHWTPMAGAHSLVWDEAVKVNGADADYHRRDLWEAIEAGDFPEWELGLQIFTEEQADAFGFDILDATKLVPEELVPVQPVGKLVLDRNPDNFFAETEQVAFCAAHIVPGVDFSNDPLLQGRIHSYLDTQISRLGGVNFHEIPINAPVAQVHNNQRDGMHRQTIHRGRVAYEPNSLAGGCPFQAGAKKGFVSFPEPVAEDKVRGKPEKFADHYSQATLFYRSQTPTEQAHIAAAFRFELTRVQTPAIRERMVALLRNVDEGLAAQLADELGLDLPPALPLALGKLVEPPVAKSPALSLSAYPGNTGVRGLKVAILVADDADLDAAQTVHDALVAQGAVPRYVAPRLGRIGQDIEAEVTLEAAPGPLWDAVVVGSGDKLKKLGQAKEFIKDQYRHCKPILALAGAQALLEAAEVSAKLPDGKDDPGVIVADGKAAGGATERFVAALTKRRHFEREMDPPPV